MTLIMYRTLALCWGALAGAAAFAQPPAGYYDPAEGLSGPALRTALRTIIDDHLVIGYSSLWSAFQSTDDKPNGKVWDMYSDVPGGTPPYEFTFGSDQCGTYSGEGDCFNREHSFPKVWFSDQPPMNSDLFHIYPTDGYVNNERGDLPYGKVGSADWTGQNGSKKGLCVAPGYSGTVFEPIDAYKGDLARSYFYMLTRYQTQIASWSSPMLQGGDLAPWARTLLLQWNDADPVSPKETDRNNAVYVFQHNRNPFIDRPEWVHAIWDPNAGVQEADAAAARLWTDEQGLHLSRPTAMTGTVRIVDLTGRTLLERAITGVRVDLPFDAPHGAYIADVVLPEGRRAQRFVW